MILTYFHPKRRGNMENKNNSPFNIRFVAKTSDIRKCQAKCLTSSHVRMHRVTFYISNTLRKLIIGLIVWCLGKYIGLGFGLGLEKEK